VRRRPRPVLIVTYLTHADDAPASKTVPPGARPGPATRLLIGHTTARPGHTRTEAPRHRARRKKMSVEMWTIEGATQRRIDRTRPGVLWRQGATADSLPF